MDVFAKLKEPFPPNQLHFRIGSTNIKKVRAQGGSVPTSGIPLAYITQLNVMRRLNDVVGPANWQNEHYLSDGKVLCCKIGIRQSILLGTNSDLDADTWVWRSNGAGDTDVEADKGRCTDAFKRAAVMWGIGAYLYALPNTWVPLENGYLPRDKSTYIDKVLPSWARPA